MIDKVHFTDKVHVNYSATLTHQAQYRPEPLSSLRPEAEHECYCTEGELGLTEGNGKVETCY